MFTSVSIICVALEEGENVSRWKAAVDRLCVPAGWSVCTVLVDGGSRDETVAAGRRAGIDRIELRPGANLPACRNHGARAGDSDVIAYLDADCEPDPDWLLAASHWMAGGEPTLVGWPAAAADSATWVQRAWAAHWRGKNTGFTELAGRRVITRGAYRLLTTRNLLMTRSAFEALGGFDETLATGEDSNLALRAHVLGLRMIADPALRVTHAGEPGDLVSFFRQQLWHANRASHRGIRAAGEGGRALRFTELYLVLLALAVGSIAAAVAGARPWVLLAGLPFLLLLLAPAAWTAYRAGCPGWAPALAILYAVYGLARCVDLVGLHRDKTGWRVKRRRRRPPSSAPTEGGRPIPG